MPDLVSARHEAVVKAARRAKRSGIPADYHRLRIRCKRLRYSLEFSQELYVGRTARFVKQLTGLQNQLGLMQDAEVAAGRLADLARGEAHLSPTTIFVMGGVAERHRLEFDRIMDKLPKELSRVGGREWRELADVMERQRQQALALLPPVRHTLRAVPSPVLSEAPVDPFTPVVLTTTPEADATPLS